MRVVTERKTLRKVFILEIRWMESESRVLVSPLERK